MNNNTKFWDWVLERANSIGITSIRQLEKNAGLSYGAISRPRSENKLPSVIIAKALCQALEVNWYELWAQAGFTSKSSPNEDQLVSTYRALSKDHQKIALTLIQALRNNG